jgi:hypothetical protein
MAASLSPQFGENPKSREQTTESRPGCGPDTGANNSVLRFCRLSILLTIYLKQTETDGARPRTVPDDLSCPD